MTWAESYIRTVLGEAVEVVVTAYGPDIPENGIKVYLKTGASVKWSQLDDLACLLRTTLINFSSERDPTKSVALQELELSGVPEALFSEAT